MKMTRNVVVPPAVVVSSDDENTEETKEKKKDVKYVVQRRMHGTKRTQPKHKGPYRLVDPRQKKDDRQRKKTERRGWNRARFRAQRQ